MKDTQTEQKESSGLYIALISVHGLIRFENQELGKDADTGGQILYATELAKNLSLHKDVAQVDLLTRQIFDNKVSADYSQAEEKFDKATGIIRISCGPRRYLRKEVLWPYLDSFVDRSLAYFRRIGRIPDIIHAHYADAGYVGSKLSAILGVPLIFTGHSLGRVKLKRLLEQGLNRSAIQKSYNIQQRIEAEEMTLDYAGLVIASTHQEVEEQYKAYDNYEPERMRVLPPGVNLDRFSAPEATWSPPGIKDTIDKFFQEPEKPIILAMSRPDPRKNIQTLIKAYGENDTLQEKANLLIIAGNRSDIQEMDKESRQVLTEILLLIDKYNLYGRIAYPKTHKWEEVPDIYRMVTRSKGVFINPALTEPFGLTLIEAAASGTPILATQDGGPRDILNTCNNGMLIDPLDSEAMSRALLDALSDRERWQKWSQNGLKASHNTYSWRSHVKVYLDELKTMLKKKVYKNHYRAADLQSRKSRIPGAHKMIIADVDNTLIGDNEALQKFLDKMENSRIPVGFGIATGRHINSTLEVLKRHEIATPDVLITSAGTEIYYGPGISPDRNWTRHINYRWKPDEARELMSRLPGLIAQKPDQQTAFKLSYVIDPKKAPHIREMKKILRNSHIHANILFSLGMFIDIIPVRASKGSAIRYFALKWGLPLKNFLVMGDSGNDIDMLGGELPGVVVGNYSPELKILRKRDQIYFAKGEYAEGILEGLDHYNFLEEKRDHQDPNKDSNLNHAYAENSEESNEAKR